MKVIFIGIHNKEDKVPLCSSTKTGKVIDKIIKEIPVKCQKTNLYDVEYFPFDEKEKQDLAKEWIERIDPDPFDLIVTIGADVKEHFINLYENKVISIRHPASIYAKNKTAELINKTIERIKIALGGLN
jgi:hypothetical protein